MISSGKSVSLVPSFLEIFFKGARHSSQLRIRFIKDEAILFAIKTLSDSDHGDIEFELAQNLLDTVHLPLTAVDDHDVWQWP